VRSSNSPQSIAVWSKAIKDIIDVNDFYLVIDITNQGRQGWLPKEAWDWISNHEKLN